MRALQQPRWWRSWYPRAFRRRGDVWSRLPHELRRFRLCRGIYQIYMLGIVLPLQLTAAFGRHLAVVSLLLMWSIAFVGMVLLLTERRRATKFVRAKISTTAGEASAILTAPTWRVSTWRRTPTASLLSGRGHTLNRSSDAADTIGPEHRPTAI
jgi:hypothetical protein